MPRRRDLTSEERLLWQRVAETADPLARDAAPDPPAAPAAAAPAAVPPVVPLSAPVPRVLRPTGRPEPQVRLDLAGDPHDAPPVMDRRRYEKLRRGKLPVEATLDLHGMRVEQAHRALTRFVLTSAGRGLRLLLVITGKGRDPSDQPWGTEHRGVLRHAVPAWLREAPCGPLVMQVSPAAPKDGGRGALYVYLRRRR